MKLTKLLKNPARLRPQVKWHSKLISDFKNCRYFQSDTLRQTREIAKSFSSCAQKGSCFALYGDLGVGKTTFSKFLIKSLNPEIQIVTSPTFNIIQTYSCSIADIWHIDCYRLKSADEIFELGLEEAFSECITIIEWPKIIEDFLPQNTLKIYFSLKNSSRIIEADIQRQAV